MQTLLGNCIRDSIRGDRRSLPGPIPDDGSLVSELAIVSETRNYQNLCKFNDIIRMDKRERLTAAKRPWIVRVNN
jgi:hypothetical protein